MSLGRLTEHIAFHSPVPETCTGRGTSMHGRCSRASWICRRLVSGSTPRRSSMGTAGGAAVQPQVHYGRQFADLAAGLRCKVVLVCYVDDSDDNLSSVAAMAGYFATEDNWAKYEQTAAQVYRAYDVTCLHCKDFRLTKGEVTGWPHVKKNSFIEELFQAAHGMVSCGISVCMSKSLHKSFRAFGRTGHISAHGMAFGALVGKFVDGQMLPGLLGQKEIGFKVESSNKDGEFLHTFNAFVRSGDAPTIKFVEFVKKEELPRCPPCRLLGDVFAKAVAASQRPERSDAARPSNTAQGRVQLHPARAGQRDRNGLGLCT